MELSTPGFLGRWMGFLILGASISSGQITALARTLLSWAASFSRSVVIDQINESDAFIIQRRQSVLMPRGASRPVAYPEAAGACC